MEEAEPKDSEVGSLIIVTEAVKQLCSSSTAGMDDICPEILKALDAVGLS